MAVTISTASGPMSYEMLRDISGAGTPFLDYVTSTQSSAQILPMPEPVMSEQDMAKFRGQLLLKLLEI